MYIALFPISYSCREVTLATHPNHVVRRIRKCRAVSPYEALGTKQGVVAIV
jgi:hypothetical protein